MKWFLQIKPILEKYPAFLLFIPLSFLIHKANYYYSLLVWKYIIIDIILYITIPISLFIVIGKLWRSYAKAGATLCILLVIFYFFQPFYDELKTIRALSFFTKYSVILPVLLICVIFLIIYIHRSKKNFRQFYYISNLLFLLLLIGGCFQYIYLSIKNPVFKYDQADPSKNLSKKYIPCNTCTKPDIYFLLFDGYTNSKTLKQEFEYNNRWIENKLGDKGFWIPSHSNSNYNFTHMSIGSELNLSYLSNLDNNHRFYTKDFFEANYTIYHNELCDILIKQGYEISNFSIFDIKNNPVKVTPAITQLTWRSVMGQTFFNKLRREIGWHFLKFYPKGDVSSGKKKKIKEDIKRISETFEGAVNSTRKTSAKPLFLYTHFLLPHETYYFDSSGKRLDVSYTANTLINPKDYVNQVAYTNKFVMAPLIDSIFKNASRPFVIIIQGDHGYRNYPLEKVYLEFENFSAIYFSDENYSAFSNDSLSSVNTFRIVLNKYFNQNLPLLKDTAINLYKYNTE